MPAPTTSPRPKKKPSRSFEGYDPAKSVPGYAKTYTLDTLGEADNRALALASVARGLKGASAPKTKTSRPSTAADTSVIAAAKQNAAANPRPAIGSSVISKLYSVPPDSKRSKRRQGLII